MSSDSPLCKYSDFFGRPGEGAHAIRIGGFAAVDLLATAGLAFLLTLWCPSRANILTFTVIFIILILAGIVFHEAFCVRTRLNAAIFGRPWAAAKAEAEAEAAAEAKKE